MSTADVSRLVGEDDPELDLLLEGIYRRYHYDFRHYVRPLLRRRVDRAMRSLSSASIHVLLDLVSREPAAFAELLGYLTIKVSDLFRDPGYYLELRQKVLPHLRTYPSLKVWIAGCGTGEEAYSFAILLHEEGLLDRSIIYATDIDPRSLRVAAAGAYDLERMRGFSESYFLSGGRASLSDYYTAAYSRAAFSPLLRRRLVFADHNLATDAGFAEVQLVSCRNVLIYFDRQLQDRALGLCRESLCPRGFLGLGGRESLTCSAHAAAFEAFVFDQRIYRMR